MPIQPEALRDVEYLRKMLSWAQPVLKKAHDAAGVCFGCPVDVVLQTAEQIEAEDKAALDQAIAAKEGKG